MIVSNSPCRDQSEKSIRNWLHAHIHVGVVVAIRRARNGTLQYERAAVLSIRPKNFNVGPQQRDGTFADAGITFDQAGRSWREPDGGMRLVMPTEEVLAACDACDFGAAFLPQQIP